MNNENINENTNENDIVQDEKFVSAQTEAMPKYNYDYNEKEPKAEDVKQEKKKSNAGKVFLKIGLTALLAVLFGLIASGVFIGTNALVGKFAKDDTPKTTTTNTKLGKTEIVESEGTKVESNIVDVAESVMPSVVSITNLSIQEVQSFFFGGVQKYESQSSGSGIIIGQTDSDVIIVTNNHVVEGSKTLTVTFVDGNNIEAQIRGTDSLKDLAIISVPLSSLTGETKSAIKVAVLGDSNALRVGEPTIAIGNALGYGQSVTTGIVSALNRTIDTVDGNLIQTDAAINPGNSGGALLNANGEVIGINTAKVNASAVEGMGYAIPITDVKDVLQKLINKEQREKVPKSERGSIGIYGVDISADVAALYNIPQGIYVREVESGGGADKAGISIYSVITAINGYSVETQAKLQEELQYYRAGETVKLTIYVQTTNGYVEKTVKVKLS